MDFPAALVIELLKVMLPAPRQKISVKRLESPKRPVALKAAPTADSPRRLAARALPNSDRQLTSASEFRSVVAKQMARATPLLRHLVRQTLPAP